MHVFSYFPYLPFLDNQWNKDSTEKGIIQDRVFCPPYLLLMPVTLFLSQKVMLVCGTHSSLQWRKKLIIYLQQDGKTAEDLAKSEQHEHVAGLLTRLRKVRNFVLWNALCFLCEKCCLVPYNRWKWTLCWTHRWYQKAPVLGCGLLINLHKRVAPSLVSSSVLGLGNHWPLFVVSVSDFLSLTLFIIPAPCEVEGKWKSRPCFFLS